MVLIMTVTVCAIMGAVILRSYVTGQPLPTEQARLVAAIITTMLAVITLYVGNKIKHRDED